MFTKMFTMIILVYSLKCMCIPSIGCCISEFYIPFVMYGLRLVLQELQCLQHCLHVDIIRVIGIYHFTKSCSSTPSGF